MLISHPPLDSTTFSNPVDSLLLPYSSTAGPDDFPPPPGGQGWPRAPSSSSPPHREEPPAEEDYHPPSLERLLLHSTEPEDIFRTAVKDSHPKHLGQQERTTENHKLSLDKLLLQQPESIIRKEDVYRTASQSPVSYPKHLGQSDDVCKSSETSLEGLLLHQLKDCFRKDKQHRKLHKPKVDPIKLLPASAEAMSVVEPEDDLRCLVENERKLELCGYYYGSLSWLDASHLLRQCRVGTFLVRDSEHGSYLYTLSVQTRKGPTSCRIEYAGGSFRLDSSKDLSHKMPRFDCVTNLIDFYVCLPRYLPTKNCNKAVWLDMDEENTLDVPVQIYRPLYKQVRSLQHMCRVSIMRQVEDKWGVDPLQGNVLPCKPFRTNPSMTLQKALEKDPEYKQLPNIIKEYLSQYPYSQ